MIISQKVFTASAVKKERKKQIPPGLDRRNFLEYTFFTFERFEKMFKAEKEMTAAGVDRREWVRNMPYKLLFIQSKNSFGTAVAHLLAKHGFLPEERLRLGNGNLNMELLSLRDRYGKTTAHFLAANGYLPKYCMTYEVLCLADKGINGMNIPTVTVAHWLAKKGLFPKHILAHSAVLAISDSNGDSVAHFLLRHSPKPFDFSWMQPGMEGWKNTAGESLIQCFETRLAELNRTDEHTAACFLAAFPDHFLLAAAEKTEDPMVRNWYDRAVLRHEENACLEDGCEEAAEELYVR